MYSYDDVRLGNSGRIRGLSNRDHDPLSTDSRSYIVQLLMKNNRFQNISLFVASMGFGGGNSISPRKLDIKKFSLSQNLHIMEWSIDSHVKNEDCHYRISNTD